jgi:hypothetical protein
MRNTLFPTKLSGVKGWLAATGVVHADSRVSSQPGWCVESSHEFAGGRQVFFAFVELLLKVEVVLWCAA